MTKSKKISSFKSAKTHLFLKGRSIQWLQANTKQPSEEWWRELIVVSWFCRVHSQTWAESTRQAWMKLCRRKCNYVVVNAMFFLVTQCKTCHTQSVSSILVAKIPWNENTKLHEVEWQWLLQLIPLYYPGGLTPYVVWLCTAVLDPSTFNMLQTIWKIRVSRAKSLSCGICKLLLGHLKPVFNFSGYP